MTNKPNMLHGLLQLVEASDGTVDSRIRLQKEAYLLAVAGFDQISARSFSYHHYGPFSRELSDCLQLAVSTDLLGEVLEPGANEGRKYSYSLLERGNEYLSQAGHAEERFRDLIKACKSEHWRVLELAATSLFLEKSEEIGRTESLTSALSLKPETTRFKDHAIKFLDAYFPPQSA